MNDVLLFDGHCRFCKKTALELKAQTGGELTLQSFRDIDPTQYGITLADCEKKVHLLFNGRVESGVGAIVQAPDGTLSRIARSHLPCCPAFSAAP